MKAKGGNRPNVVQENIKERMEMLREEDVMLAGHREEEVWKMRTHNQGFCFFLI